MFMTIRLIIGVSLGLLAIYLTRNIIFASKKVRLLIVFLLAMFLTIVLAFLPFENAFYTFSSPESAFCYYVGKCDIELNVEGARSNLVVGDKKGTNTILIIPKEKTGWNIGVGANTKLVNKKLFDNCVVLIYQHTGVGDQYVVVEDIRGGVTTLSDAYDSSFHSLIQGENTKEQKVTYFAYIPSVVQTYWVCINGEEVLLTD